MLCITYFHWYYIFVWIMDENYYVIVEKWIHHKQETCKRQINIIKEKYYNVDHYPHHFFSLEYGNEYNSANDQAHWIH